jgi:hypothetical protein
MQTEPTAARPPDWRAEPVDGDASLVRMKYTSRRGLRVSATISAASARRLAEELLAAAVVIDERRDARRAAAWRLRVAPPVGQP